jgi:FkbH-like protein
LEQRGLSNDSQTSPAAREDLSELRAELGRAQALSVAQIERAYRRLSGASDAARLRVAWLANHTIEPVVRSAAVSAFVHDLLVADYIAPFDQYFQAILDENSALNQFSPQALVLWLSLRRLDPVLLEGGAGLSDGERDRRAQAVLERVGQWVGQARERTTATIFIANFVRPPRPRLGIADTRCASGEGALFARLNSRLADTYRDDPRVMVLDVDQAVAGAGRASAWNPQMYRLAKIEWDGIAARHAGELFARALRAICVPARKCLAVDLDNTLWGGVVGEDGPAGIKIGEGDPVGESFLAFQRVLLDLKARGILLAICSKNNLEDAEEAFARNHMPLALEDFAAARINWNNKPDNLREIAAELNIGTDSLVFVDDNPAECELVRRLVPEVCTIQLPSDPACYADLLLDTWEFDKLLVTPEDSRKTQQYRDNTARATAQASFQDLTEYLESLGTRVQVAAADPQVLPRLHQLFSKTNQFNLTTKRYTPAEVEAFATSPDWRLEYVRAQDNFGDLGIIGLYLLSLRNRGEPEIDSFILSCRAMGRGIETVMCNRLKQIAFQELGAASLQARFEPTRKNRPAESFYEGQGFEVVYRDDDGRKLYRLHRENSSELPCQGIAAIDMELRRE